MPQTALFLFGLPRLERQGASLEVDTRKASALLAYLAIAGGQHARDELAAFLWPELDQSRARAALRRTLSALRAAVGEAFLEISREVVALQPGADLWVDTAEFQRRLEACGAHGHPPGEVCPRCLPELSAAAELYRADFLAGFTLRDSASFDDWQFMQGEQLRRQLAGALERLVRGYSQQADYRVASEFAHRWLNLDPLHEPAHRQLMQLYAWSGRRALALRQYQECVKVLRDELGVSPLEETVQLYECIRENRLPAPAQPPAAWAAAGEPGSPWQVLPQALAAAPPQVPAHISRLPLVGRAAAWGAILKAYQELRSGGPPVGYLLGIEGEAGVGKTRLAEEFASHAAQLGAIVVRARCYEGEADLSYGLFVESLRAALGPPRGAGWLEEIPAQWLGEAARLLPELGELRPGLPEPTPLDGPGAQSRFFEAIHQLLLAICRGPVPGVLFIDDLHWADAASLDLLAYLVRRIRRQPLFILGTWREAEVGARPRLRQLLSEAQRAGNASLVALGRLSYADVLALVAALPGKKLSAQVASRLYQETEGLPFFLSEYVAAHLQDASADHEPDWSLPGGARDLLHARLAQVSETGLQVLTAAAVIGRSFDYETLREASGRSDEEAVRALEDLLTLGLIGEMGDPGEESGLQYDFNHAKLRGLVYAETNRARRQLLHRRVAEALANRARLRKEPGRLAGQIARHYKLAGETDLAAASFVAAGEYARGLYANRDALNHFQNALSAGHPERAAVYAAIGDLQVLLGEYRQAIDSYQNAAAAASQGMTAALAHKLGMVHGRLGDWALADNHFQAALAAGDESARPAIYADWSLAMHRQGQAARACQLAEKALQLSEALGDAGALAQAHNILGVLARHAGDFAGARRHLETSLALAEEESDVAGQVAALNNLALVFSQQDESGRAAGLLQQALALCVAIGDRHREAALHSNLADLLHASGDLEEAMAHLKRCAAINAEIGAESGSWQPEIWKLVEW